MISSRETFIHLLGDLVESAVPEHYSEWPRKTLVTNIFDRLFDELESRQMVPLDDDRLYEIKAVLVTTESIRESEREP